MKAASQRSYTLDRGRAVEGYINRDGRFVPHGELCLSYANGQPALKSSFVHGVAEGPCYRWYGNGQKMSRHNYVGGLPHGEFVQWYRSGNLARSGRYAAGRAQGLHRLQYDGKKGRRLADLQYKGGRPSGKQREWREDGAPISVSLGESGLATWEGFAVDTHARHVCILVSTEQALCASVEEIVYQLSQIMTLSQVELVLQGLNDLYDSLGLDNSGSVLLQCPSGLTTLPGSGSNSAAQQPPDLDEMVAACRGQSIDDLQAAGIGDPAALSDGVWNAWVDTQIDRMDDLFASCSEPVNPLVAQGEEPVSGDTTGEPTNSDDELSWTEEVKDWFKERDQEAGQAVKEFGDNLAQLVSVAINNPDKAALAVAIVIGWRVLKAAMDEPPDPAGSLNQSFALKQLTDYVDNFAKGLLLDEEEGEGKVDDTPNAPPIPTPGGGQNLPEGGGTSCAEQQAWWGQIKQMCDDADWKTLDCMAFLGVSTRCLEQILPAPDGSGFVCAGGVDSRDTDSLVRKVRRLQCEMTAGLFIDDHCVEPGDVGPGLVYDLCQDPRAQWLPDQCLGAVLGSIQLATQGPSQEAAATRVETVTEERFEEEVAEAAEPSVVVFSRGDCAPCHRLLGTLADAADDYRGRVRFRNVDIGLSTSLAQRYGIEFTPTMLMFHGGTVVGQRRVGAAPAHRILRFIDNTLADIPKRRSTKKTKGKGV